MYDLVKKYKIGIIIVKDSSRLGRNYIEVGQLIEIEFKKRNIRFISVDENTNSINGEDDFGPFRYVFNEMYAKECSKKLQKN